MPLIIETCGKKGNEGQNVIICEFIPYKALPISLFPMDDGVLL